MASLQDAHAMAEVPALPPASPSDSVVPQLQFTGPAMIATLICSLVLLIAWGGIQLVRLIPALVSKYLRIALGRVARGSHAEPGFLLHTIPGGTLPAAVC